MALRFSEGDHVQGLPMEELSPVDLFDYPQAVWST